MSLVPGEYLLQVRAGEGLLPATKPHTDSEAVALRLQPPRTVRGRVVDAAGRTVAPDGFRVIASARQGQEWLRSAEVGSEGAFEIRGLLPGTVTLGVGATVGYLPATIEVAAGEEHVAIVLQPRPAKPK